jgi:hypothetical protein
MSSGLLGPYRPASPSRLQDLAPSAQRPCSVLAGRWTALVGAVGVCLRWGFWSLDSRAPGLPRLLLEVLSPDRGGARFTAARPAISSPCPRPRTNIPSQGVARDASATRLDGRVPGPCSGVSTVSASDESQSSPIPPRTWLELVYYVLQSQSWQPTLRLAVLLTAPALSFALVIEVIRLDPRLWGSVIAVAASVISTVALRRRKRKTGQPPDSSDQE